MVRLVAPLTDHDKVVLCPGFMVEGLAPNKEMVGEATMFMFAVPVGVAVLAELVTVQPN